MLSNVWEDRAACANPSGSMNSLFFAEESGDNYSDARRVCAGCPVKSECLEFAISAGHKEGMWGGLSPHERNKLINRRAKAARKARQLVAL